MRLNCLRCNTLMQHIRDEQLQLGKTSWILGDWPNLLAGAMEVSLYACPSCGKLEFFQSELSRQESAMPLKRCPRCGKEHDFDYPKCPFCKYDYSQE